jgi:myo-inositol-1(or 4)-monophosphatase
MRQPLVNIATRAATAAGNVIVRYTNRLDNLSVSEKQRNDFVSEVDKAAEKEIVRTLQKAYPQFAILTEEAGHLEARQKSSEDGEWIVDPLDGTSNFIHGVPHYSVSIAFRERGKITHGVVFDPVRNELFTASAGNGAYCNDQRLRVSDQKELDRCLLATGLPYRNRGRVDEFFTMLRKAFDMSEDIRRAGSAALDLAYVAAGRLDGYWEMGLEPWDMAAGALMVREAGGTVLDFKGGENYLDTGDIIATNVRLAPKLTRTLMT